ncbi:MAG: 4-hydroxy-tetrahydrodipicolinate reductase [Nanohaloarchaea archaeon SW_7_46_7]|nr:MAG: 4-hydroxy-tetrahydrodipicolinate reductase [Nanohaloarchaea archaeon SW_7_46_7]
MDIAVTGATGQMGNNVIKVARDREENISTAADREKTEHRGLEVESDGNFEQLLRENSVDVIIDFTVPEATMEYLEAAKKTSTPLVIGTTGFSDEQEKRIEEAGEEIPVLKASNFSPSINVMRELVREASGKLEDYDIEVTETHHNRKRDAPSGTAKTFLRGIEEARGGFEEVHGREGKQPREKGEIGVHARRAGDIKGTHEVLLAGDEEVLKIRHRSESREVFASGALRAAEWLQDRKSGFYSFSEVLEE